MFDAIGEGHKIMQRSVSHDEALRQAYAADPTQAVIDMHELAREANELEDRVLELERHNAGLEARIRFLTEERDTLEWELNDIKRAIDD